MIKTIKTLLSNQALWFLMVGAAAAGVHFLALITLVTFTYLTPAWANVFAFFIAFIVSFLGHFHFTFKPKPAIDRGENNRNNSIYQKHHHSCQPITKINNPNHHNDNANSRNTATLITSKPSHPALVKALMKWFASSLLGFLANQTLFLIGLNWFGQPYYPLIWLTVTAVITVMTFALGKLWAFNHD